MRLINQHRRENTMTKQFSLRTILTVTTGRLLTVSNGLNDNGIGDLYEILGWMTGDSPFTHQLGRFAEECKPILMETFPDLAVFNDRLDLLDSMRDSDLPETAVDAWINWVKSDNPGIQDAYEVPKIEKHEHIDALDELATMMNPERIIPVVVG